MLILAHAVLIFKTAYGNTLCLRVSSTLPFTELCFMEQDHINILQYSEKLPREALSLFFLVGFETNKTISFKTKKFVDVKLPILMDTFT